MDWRVRKVAEVAAARVITTRLLLLLAVTVAVAGEQAPQQQQAPPPQQQPPQQQGGGVEYKTELVEPYQEAPKPPGPGPKYESGNSKGGGHVALVLLIALVPSPRPPQRANTTTPSGRTATPSTW